MGSVIIDFRVSMVSSGLHSEVDTAIQLLKANAAITNVVFRAFSRKASITGVLPSGECSDAIYFIFLKIISIKNTTPRPMIDS